METIQLKLSGEDDYFTQEAYKTLRTNLQFCGQDIRVIAITSCKENEGKTTVALNIAKSFAELGKKVLVIDADMRKSVMVGRNTDAKDVCGLSEILAGVKSLQGCICKTQYQTLNILFAGKYPPNPAELLNKKIFASLLEAAKEVYDYVIIDTPPLEPVIDAAVVATQCDGVVLVLSNAKIRYQLAQSVVAQLKKSGCQILGVVRNNLKVKKGSYYSKYKYKYKYKY